MTRTDREVGDQAGKFRTIPRTEGVSTTDIVGRMLLMTKEHHFHHSFEVLGSKSKFLTTSRMLQLFSANVRSPGEGMRVIYIDGAWDLFHPGHVAILKAAREVRARASWIRVEVLCRLTREKNLLPVQSRSREEII